MQARWKRAAPDSRAMDGPTNPLRCNMLRPNTVSPLDRQLGAYGDNTVPEDVLPTDYRHWVEDVVVVGTEVYEMLDKRHRLSEGLASLRRRSDPEAVEAMHRLRDWLTTTRTVVLPAIPAIEGDDFNAVPNSPHLRTYADRAEGMLREWDATLTQANVGWRDTEVSDEGSQAFHEAVSGGRAKVKFKTPPAPRA